MTATHAPRRTRWGLIIPWAIAGLIVVGWCGYWFALRHAALEALGTWSQAQIAAGGAPGYREARVGGFPLRLEVTLTDGAYHAPDGGMVASTPLAVVAINPVNPNHTLFMFPQAVTYSLHGGSPRVLTAASLQASLRNENGRLARFSLEGQGLRAALPEAGDGQGLQVESLTLHVRPDERDSADWQVAAQALGIRVASPVRAFERLGQRIDTLTLGVVLTKAEAIAAPHGASDPLLLWRQAGGEARIESSEIVWGPARATGTGAVRLDALARLEGRLSLQLEDVQALLSAIGGVNGGLTALLAQNLAISELTFTAQDGALYWQAETPLGDIAPQALRNLGPIYTPMP